MKKALICFTRVPRPGATKTRLLGLLSPEQCARLHWAFLQDLAGVYEQVGADLFISHTPDPNWEELKAAFPRAAGWFPQEGVDLGEKMHNTITRVLALGYEAVVLTGADLPLLTPAHLQSGFAVLGSRDVAIGPNPDGGYYLIGMKQPHPSVFHVSGYGGATAFENTVAAIEASELTYGLALPCADVDTPDDLRTLAGTVNAESATGRCLVQFQKEGVAL